MREKGQTEVAKTLETPVFSRGIEILTEKSELFEYMLSDQGVPMILDSPVSMACSVEDIYETKGFENFICRIDATYADETVLNSENKIDYHVFKPVLFEMPTYEYFITGNSLGKCMSLGKDMDDHKIRE